MSNLVLDVMFAVLIIRSFAMSAATDRLTASVNALASAVDSAVTKIETNTDEGLVNDTAAHIDDLTAKLNAATPASPSV